MRTKKKTKRKSMKKYIIWYQYHNDVEKKTAMQAFSIQSKSNEWKVLIWSKLGTFKNRLISNYQIDFNPASNGWLNNPYSQMYTFLLKTYLLKVKLLLNCIKKFHNLSSRGWFIWNGTWQVMVTNRQLQTKNRDLH